MTIHRCKKDRWLAKQWNNVCSGNSNDTFNDISQSQSLSQMYHHMPGKRSNFSASNFLKAMVHERRHGSDLYLAKIWRKFHPEQNYTTIKKVITVHF